MKLLKGFRIQKIGGLAAGAARRTAAGQDGVASLQQQARDYLAEIEKDGITPDRDWET